MIKIITVGQLKEKYLKEAVEEYTKRTKRWRISRRSKSN